MSTKHEKEEEARERDEAMQKQRDHDYEQAKKTAAKPAPKADAPHPGDIQSINEPPGSEVKPPTEPAPKASSGSTPEHKPPTGQQPRR